MSKPSTPEQRKKWMATYDTKRKAEMKAEGRLFFIASQERGYYILYSSMHTPIKGRRCYWTGNDREEGRAKCRELNGKKIVAKKIRAGNGCTLIRAKEGRCEKKYHCPEYDKCLMICLNNNWKGFTNTKEGENGKKEKGSV